MRAAGYSLIEVIIGLLIIALLLLGFDAMQVTVLREAKIAYYFSIANQQLHVMTERLRMLGNHDVEEQLFVWNKQNEAVLPQGKGTVSGIYPHYVLTISWGKITQQSCEHNKIGLSGCLRLSVEDG